MTRKAAYADFAKAVAVRSGGSRALRPPVAIANVPIYRLVHSDFSLAFGE